MTQPPGGSHPEAEAEAEAVPDADADQSSASWLDASRVRTLSLILLATYALITYGWLHRVHDGVDPQGKAIGYDFLAFWSAAKLALAGRAGGAYDAAILFAQERAEIPKLALATAFPYPPAFLFIVAPFGAMPYLVGYGAFVTSTLGAYAAVVRRAFGTNACLLPFFAFSGVYVNALSGQNGFLTGALVGAALVALPGSPLVAGVCFGLLTIKPHLGLLVPFALLASRSWRTLAAAAVTALALHGASVAAFGSSTLAAFFAKLPEMSRAAAANELPLRKMPTLFAAARLAHIPTPAAYAIHLLVALGVAALVVWIWRRQADEDLRNAALVSGSLLASPYLYDYDLAWLALTIAFFVRYALREGFRRGEREMLLALWLLPFSVVLLHDALRVQIAPLVLVGAFGVIARRGMGGAGGVAGGSGGARAGGGGAVSGAPRPGDVGAAAGIERAS